MPTTCDSFDALHAAVCAAGWRRIGIDGVDGSGKSHLAAQLASSLSSVLIDVDDFLKRNQGGYTEFVDYAGLQAGISSHQKAVISGVCLREVLTRADCTVDAHIYIKRMRRGCWADESECVFPVGLPAALEQHRSDCELVSQFLAGNSAEPAQSTDGGVTLAEEMMRYHDKYRPHELADIVYERHDHAD